MPEPRTARPTRRYRILRTLLVVLGVLVLPGFALDRGLDGPLRTVVVRQLNDKLVGYHAQVREVDFHLIDLGLDLIDGDVYQDAHPTPAVIHVPRLRLSVHWSDLIRLAVVGDAHFENPTVHANLTQLREESKDPVGLTERGWQEAIEAIFPLKINELRVSNGTLVYQDDSDFRPLHATEVNLVAENIRNIRSKDREYPSTVHVEGKIFDTGRAVIDGNADFLAEPTPGIRGRISVDTVDLSYFDPLLRPFGLKVRSGVLTGNGMVEVGPSIASIDLESIVLSDTAIDYEQGAEPTPVAKKAGKEINRVAHESLNNPEMAFRARSLLLKNGTLGVVNKAENPPYRIYFTDADFELQNVSSHAEDGPCRATLKGKFMGSGKVDGQATFYPEGKQANFEMKLAVQETQLRSLNDLLRAHGKFDVRGGVFSVFSEVKVRDGRIDGYVKPLFRDIDVYDKEQDKQKNVFRKMYEGVVGGVAKLFENRRDEVVTVTDLSGPVDDPKSSALQIIANLVKNGFIKSILPGFQGEVKRANPSYYRSVEKERKEAEKARKKDEKAREKEGEKQREESEDRKDEGGSAPSRL